MINSRTRLKEKGFNFSFTPMLRENNEYTPMIMTMTTIMPLRIRSSIFLTVNTPILAPTKVKGTANFNSFLSLFPLRMYFKELVNEAHDAENLLVPRTISGGKPAN